MFSGIQEILVLVVIILAIFFIPRVLSRGNQNRVTPPRKIKIKLSGRMRLAILASILWIFLSALYFQPWRKDLLAFLVLTIGPVLMGWGTYWVIMGFKRSKRF